MVIELYAVQRVIFALRGSMETFNGPCCVCLLNDLPSRGIQIAAQLACPTASGGNIAKRISCACIESGPEDDSDKCEA